MKVIQVKDEQEMSEKAGEIVVSLIRTNPKAILGLATGSTPMGLYSYMAADHKNHRTSYQDVTTFNLDEYAGLDEDHEQSYHYFMNEQLFKHIDIPRERTFVPDGNVENLEEECLSYEALIKSYGGIDLQILGIGRNGHIGFNEPGSSFASRTQIVSLTESTLEANSMYFGSIEKVPTKAITMGIQTIMASKKIILLATGESKATAIQRLLQEEPNEDLPASALKNHPDFLVIADEQALSKVDLSLLKE